MLFYLQNKLQTYWYVVAAIILGVIEYFILKFAQTGTWVQGELFQEWIYSGLNLYFLTLASLLIIGLLYTDKDGVKGKVLKLFLFLVVIMISIIIFQIINYPRRSFIDM